MSMWRDLLVEWKARRAGRRGIESPIGRAARDVTGPTGAAFSNAWDKLDQHGDAYIKSFQPKVPPSLFVSERDRTRFDRPMPLVERCIEDAPAQSAARRAARDRSTRAKTSAEAATEPPSPDSSRGPAI